MCDLISTELPPEGIGLWIGMPGESDEGAARRAVGRGRTPPPDDEAPPRRQGSRSSAQPTAALRNARGEGMLSAFDRLGFGALLIDGKGAVLRLNTEARHYLGTCIAVTGSQLRANNASSNAALQQLVLNAVSSATTAVTAGVALARDRGHPVVAYAVRITGPAREGSNGAKAIIILVDPDRRGAPTEALLRQGFGLTPAEARLALGLAKGLDLGEIARLHTVSVETLRVQLKAIFVKTQTNRQAQLVTLLANLSLWPI